MSQSASQQTPPQPPASDRQRRPTRTTFADFASGGAPVWMKVVAGAVATPLLVAKSVARANRREQEIEVPSDPLTLALIVVALALLGACLGAALTLKDVVRERMAAGQPVAFPLQLMFGYGLVSLLLWVPLVVGVTLVVTLIAL